MKHIELEDLKGKITGGFLYLTLGTVSQIQRLTYFLFSNPSITFLYHPTRFELSQTIPYCVNFNESDLIVYIVYPNLVELKPIGLKKTDSNPYHFPSSLFIPSNCIVFLSLCSITGDINEREKSIAKKLQSSASKYEILDLRGVKDFSLFNVKERKEQTPPLTLEQELVWSLRTKEGINRWSSFTDSELYKWFITPNQTEPILLLNARAAYLIPYIMPFCDLLKKHWHSLGKNQILKTFAYWVFFSSTIWKDYPSQGLTLRTDKKNPNKYQFFFFISETSKRYWLQYITLNAYCKTSEVLLQ